MSLELLSSLNSVTFHCEAASDAGGEIVSAVTMYTTGSSEIGSGTMSRSSQERRTNPFLHVFSCLFALYF